MGTITQFVRLCLLKQGMYPGVHSPVFSTVNKTLFYSVGY